MTKKQELMNLISDIQSEMWDEYGWDWYKWVKKADVVSQIKDEVYEYAHENWVELWVDWVKLEKYIKEYVKRLIK